MGTMMSLKPQDRNQFDLQFFNQFWTADHSVLRTYLLNGFEADRRMQLLKQIRTTFKTSLKGWPRNLDTGSKSFRIQGRFLGLVLGPD
jgi:hypothetical protein